MRVYAERPGRAAGQLLSDLVAIGWVVLWVLLALGAHDLVLRLQAPGRTLVDAGGSVQGAFDGAAQSAGGLPLVGDRLADALAPGSDAGARIVAAGQQLIDTVGLIAIGAGVLVGVLGVLPVLAIWLPLRVRYTRRASAAVAARARGGDLLALRALLRRRIVVEGVDPATAWRAGDPDAVATLADLELRALGLRELRPAVRFSAR